MMLNFVFSVDSHGVLRKKQIDSCTTSQVTFTPSVNQILPQIRYQDPILISNFNSLVEQNQIGPKFEPPHSESLLQGSESEKTVIDFMGNFKNDPAIEENMLHIDLLLEVLLNVSGQIISTKSTVPSFFCEQLLLRLKPMSSAPSDQQYIEILPRQPQFEFDIFIRKMIIQTPILPHLLYVLASSDPKALCPFDKIIRSLLASVIPYWQTDLSKPRESPYYAIPYTESCHLRFTCFLVRLLAKAKWIPFPLNKVDRVLGKLSPKESVFPIVVSIFYFIKDFPPSARDYTGKKRNWGDIRQFDSYFLPLKRALIGNKNTFDEYREFFLKPLTKEQLGYIFHISEPVSDFKVDTLLGTGSSAAAFKCTTATPMGRRDLVMKILFNWESTPWQTMLKQKYMTECVILSLFPSHPNVIHPLRALVVPCLPAEFVDKIPRDNSHFREMCNNPSLSIVMPHGGITLSSFLSSSNEKLGEAARSLFVQALEAVRHIESCSIVHRDIKGDTILVDPETGKLTLIDFGEALYCRNSNLETMVSGTAPPWGNTDTIPPELSGFTKRAAKGIGGLLFPYSKCDSFALALTFWNALLPPSHKFIGSGMNRDMSEFNTHTLLREFPVQLFSSAQPQPLSAARPTTPASTTTTTTTGSAGPPPPDQSAAASSLKEVMIGMMNPDKAARLSAFDALSALGAL
ncbi:hypothetical protein Pelo_14510 [Pelomyxa schiedti]|nr:hypothetical protein Pelo_14510 [Pelomyxa schiedti]